MNHIDTSIINLLLVFTLTFIGGVTLEKCNLRIIKRGLVTSIFLLICIVLGTIFTFHGWKHDQLADMNGAVRNISIAWLPLLGYGGSLAFSHFKRDSQFSYTMQFLVIILSIGVFIFGTLLLPSIVYSVGNVSAWSLHVGFDGFIIPLFIIIVAVVERYRLPLFPTILGSMILLGICLFMSNAYATYSSLQASFIPQIFQFLVCVLGICLHTACYHALSRAFGEDSSTEGGLSLFLWLCCLVISCVILAGIFVIGELFLLRMNGG